MGKESIPEAQQDASELKFLAERKAGEMLALQVDHKGGRPKQGHDVIVLKETGIHAKESQRWQSEASVPEALFRGYVSDCRAAKEEITQAGLLSIAREESNRERWEALKKRAANGLGVSWMGWG